MKNRLCFVLIVVLSVLASACERNTENRLDLGNTSPHFVGSTTCMDCHQPEFVDWQKSDHQLAMQAANSDTVLADFDDVKVEFHDIETRFFQHEEEYKIASIGPSGQPAEFSVKYTFGHYPLQQYLVDIGKGHLQALNVAWDSRPKTEGGQRWFHLQADEDINVEHPFFWAGHFQNWNSRCAQCHSTNLEKNFNPQDDSYQTRWSEISVGCEACHGAASVHVSMAEQNSLKPDNSGFERGLKTRLTWAFNDNESIASSSGETNPDLIDMCGGCHSRRSIIGELKPFNNYHDQYRLSTIDQGLYFSDGQINDEVFVLGSFLQSKMYEQGVTCSNCHDPHSGKLLAEGNGLCLQCHKASAYDVSEHHHHQQDSEGSACVNCHMPERTYMSVDPRRDHSFVIPDPNLSTTSDVPNACADCHQDKPNAWLIQAMSEWGIARQNNVWEVLNTRLGNLDILLFKDYAQNALGEELSPIRQATLLEKLSAFPSRLAMEAAAQQLNNADPLVRRAAVRALQSMPVNVRWQLLSPLITDPVRVVRFEVANVLSDALGQVSGGDAQREEMKLQALLDEFRKSLAYSADSPGGQVAIGILEDQTGRPVQAEEAYKRALSIELNFVPALINLADHYRAAEDDTKSHALLARALKTAPDSANTNHAYGLLQVRMGKYEKALGYFKAALAQADAQPNHAYIYAVALDSQGQTLEAMKAIAKADKRWPNHLDLNMLQVSLMDKTGNTKGIHHYLSLLASVAINNPQVRQWTQKYNGRTPPKSN